MSWPVLFLSAAKSSPSTRHDFARAPLKSACSRPMNSAVIKNIPSPAHVPENVTTHNYVSATRILPYIKLLPLALSCTSSLHSLTQIHQNKRRSCNVLLCVALKRRRRAHHGSSPASLSVDKEDEVIPMRIAVTQKL